MPRHLTPRLIEAYADQSSTYQTFDPKGRMHIVCPQCRALILLLEDIPAAIRTEIARLRQDVQMINAIKRLRAVSDCGLAQAKANVQHICLAGPACNKCAAPLQSGSLLCPACFSVNLSWADSPDLVPTPGHRNAST
jgi:hypothetical protein